MQISIATILLLAVHRASGQYRSGMEFNGA